jgi:hypothetical protein
VQSRGEAKPFVIFFAWAAAKFSMRRCAPSSVAAAFRKGIENVKGGAKLGHWGGVKVGQ